jgi:hypothetical protein
VFVLSPASAESGICAWEVDEAMRLGKRIIPVLCRSLEGASPPVRLQDLNYIFFYSEPKAPGSGFGLGQAQLVEALNTDLDWLREHTRLLLRATEWDAGGRAEYRLLSGSDIVAAKAWAARRPKAAPELTPLHLEFIRASEQVEDARLSAQRKQLADMAAAQAEREKALQAAENAIRQRARLRGILFALLSVAVVVGFGIALWTNALRQQAVADRNRAEAERARADKQTEQAGENLAKAQITQARYLVGLSGQMSKEHDAGSAVLLALEALPDQHAGIERATVREAESALYQAVTSLLELAVLKGRTAVFSPDGKRVVTVSSDNTARIWDVAEGKELAVLKGHTSAVRSAAFSPDGRRIVTASADKTARLWPVFHTQELVDHAKRIVQRCLTGPQRNDLFLESEPVDWCYELGKWPYKPRRFGFSVAKLNDKLIARLKLKVTSGAVVTYVVRDLLLRPMSARHRCCFENECALFFRRSRPCAT